MNGKKTIDIIGSFLIMISFVYIIFFNGNLLYHSTETELIRQIEQKELENQLLQKQILVMKDRLSATQEELNIVQLTVNQLNNMIKQKDYEIIRLKNDISNLNNEQTNKKVPEKENKKIYLTFDDGPTTLTPKILDILKKEKVNGTFFVIGNRLLQYPQYTLRAYSEGSMILPHSYSHDYSIYTTFETFYQDYDKAKKIYKQVLGFNPPPIFRFPGGSSNHSSFEFGGVEYMPKLTVDVKKKGYYYIDWNVTSGDAGTDFNNSSKLLENIVSQAKGKDTIVILFHDVSSNTSTAEILSEVIDLFKKQGFQFRTFRDITEKELEQLIGMKISNKTIIR